LIDRNGNGNTVAIGECKNRGSASGFDTAVDQECENLICTHPGENAACTQEGTATQAAQTPIEISGQGTGDGLQQDIFCPDVLRSGGLGDVTFSASRCMVYSVFTTCQLHMS
jgi:hypothetical protein